MSKEQHELAAVDADALQEVQAELRKARHALADLTGVNRELPKSDAAMGRIRSEIEWLRARAESEWETSLRERAFGQAMMEATPNGVILLNNEGRIQSFNPKAAKLLSLRNESIGRTPLEAVPIFGVHEAVSNFRLGKEVADFACPSGAYDLFFSINRVDEDVIMLVITDITRFHQAQRARADFVANVSHELRTPMTAIMGYAETLMVDLDQIPDELAPLVETIFRNSRRLRDMFEDLLELHRIESRGHELELEFCELGPVLAEALVSVADKAVSKNQDFSVECRSGLSAWIHREALSTIVSNLANNACNYTPEGGTVRVVATENDSGDVLLAVIDNGIGIDEIHHDRIFERFYRVDEGRSRRQGGTGLGLAIVKHLAQASNCTVKVRSQRGKGTTFEVVLPMEKR